MGSEMCIRDRCTNCGRSVVIWHAVKHLGWVLHHPSGQVVDRSGECWGLATVEHLTPQSKGGTDDPNNVTLYCLTCNYKSSNLGRPMAEVTP